MSKEEGNLKVKAFIKIIYLDAKVAQTVQKAVSPDNIQVPEGISIKVSVQNNTLQITLCTKSLGSMIATVDDLLSCIQAAEKAIVCIDRN